MVVVPIATLLDHVGAFARGCESVCWESLPSYPLTSPVASPSLISALSRREVSSLRRQILLRGGPAQSML